jgi:hypothetical protein
MIPPEALEWALGVSVRSAWVLRQKIEVSTHETYMCRHCATEAPACSRGHLQRRMPLGMQRMLDIRTLRWQQPLG